LESTDSRIYIGNLILVEMELSKGFLKVPSGLHRSPEIIAISNSISTVYALASLVRTGYIARTGQQKLLN